jgi:hypothetical protein
MMNGPDLSGVRIRWLKRAGGRYHLVRDDGTIAGEVQRRVGSLRWVKVGDRVHHARYKREWLYWGVERRVRAMEDILNGRVAFTVEGSHFNRHDNSVIRFTDGRTLTFPVEGTSAFDVKMQAVDEYGKTLIWFRPAESGPWIRKGISLSRPIEVVVNPDEDLADDLVLVIAVASPFLHQYFRTRSGGGVA